MARSISILVGPYSLHLYALYVPGRSRTNVHRARLAIYLFMSIIPTDPIWIEQDVELAELCERWSQQAAIAVDTEFMRSDTFYPIAGLLQIGDGTGCYLIDPLAIQDFEPLRQMLLNPRSEERRVGKHSS